METEQELEVNQHVDTEERELDSIVPDKIEAGVTKDKGKNYQYLTLSFIDFYIRV